MVRLAASAIMVGTAAGNGTRARRVDPSSGSALRAAFQQLPFFTHHIDVPSGIAQGANQPDPRSATAGGPFLAQSIAQERLASGLTIDQPSEGVAAYRRRATEWISIRAGATICFAV